MQRDGLTIVPTKMYFKKGKAKLELAVAKGKKQFDKRAVKKNKETGIVIEQDILENQVNPVYLGIGSNLGNKINNIELAKSKLILNDIMIVKSSSYYESLSWPDNNNPKFYNVVVKVLTKLSPFELISVCKTIENKPGTKEKTSKCS